MYFNTFSPAIRPELTAKLKAPPAVFDASQLSPYRPPAQFPVAYQNLHKTLYAPLLAVGNFVLGVKGNAAVPLPWARFNALPAEPSTPFK